MLIAHRGMVNEYLKENTIPAFLGALKSSRYAGIELDIYMSKDKEFIVYHDLLYKGKFIKDYTYKELKKEGICKLEQVLNLKSDKLFLIDIKDLNIDVEKFKKVLNKYKKKKIYVMSFFNSVIKKLGVCSFKKGVLNYVLNSTSKYEYDFMGIMYVIATDYMIESLKKMNIEVFLYALNKRDKYIFNDVYYIVDDEFF